MRLINTNTLELEEFFGADVPKYAILSHTWKSDEVSFADMRAGTRSGTERYLKLESCCKQARKDGHKYAWVDTCCIDKSSSAELSEAINSMYKWYHDAEICYVYMEDISMNQTSPNSSRPPYGLQYLALSRWFTRGWTLQELIAPLKIDFFDQSWILFGTKTTLLSPLEYITGVDKEILDGSLPLSEISIAKRMSWASKRQTTRVEDIAYCLMGIFDVNMPLLYGEGGKAFTRLLEEILKDSDDHSIFAWTANNEALQDSKSGLLATSPSQYACSYGYIPFRTWGTSVPHSMTNKGLSIQLEMRAQSSASIYFLGLLNCWTNKDRKERVALRMKCLEGDQFYRTSTSQLVSTPSQGTKPRRIFVRKHIDIAKNEDIVRGGIVFNVQQHIPGVSTLSIEHLEAFPGNRWDQATRQFHASPDSNPAGILSFEDKEGTVLVTLGRSEYSNIGWCLLKHTTEKEYLQAIYDEMQSNSKEMLEKAGWSESLYTKDHIFTTMVRLEDNAEGLFLPSYLVRIQQKSNQGLYYEIIS